MLGSCRVATNSLRHLSVTAGLSKAGTWSSFISNCAAVLAGVGSAEVAD